MTVYREVSELPRCGSCGKLLTVGGIGGILLLLRPRQPMKPA